MTKRTETSRTRAADSRDVDNTSNRERPPMDAWAPSTMITQIPDVGGYRHKWVRENVNGTEDPRNIQMHIAEGYERVKAENLPEGAYCEEDTKGDGCARWGGLLLMRLPIEFANQRQQHYLDQSQKASDAVDVLQGVAGKDAVREDRGTRSFEGADAAQQLATMSKT